MQIEHNEETQKVVQIGEAKYAIPQPVTPDMMNVPEGIMSAEIAVKMLNGALGNAITASWRRVCEKAKTDKKPVPDQSALDTWLATYTPGTRRTAEEPDHLRVEALTIIRRKLRKALKAGTGKFAPNTVVARKGTAKDALVENGITHEKFLEMCSGVYDGAGNFGKEGTKQYAMRQKVLADAQVIVDAKLKAEAEEDDEFGL